MSASIRNGLTGIESTFDDLMERLEDPQVTRHLSEEEICDIQAELWTLIEAKEKILGIIGEDRLEGYRL